MSLLNQNPITSNETIKSVAYFLTVEWVGLVTVLPILASVEVLLYLHVSSLWIAMYCVLAVLYALIRWVFIGDLKNRGQIKWDKLALFGIFEFVTLTVVFALFVALRIQWSLSFASAVGCIFLLGLLFLPLTLLAIGLLYKVALPTIALAALDLLVGPTLSAWLIISMVFGMKDAASLIQRNKAEFSHVQTRKLNADLERTWNGINVAVSLSGGGYRAAAIHAGVLSVFAQAKIPIHILSTVSGGSIVGGAYTAGWKPEEFRDFLVAKKPGLPEDMMNLLLILGSLSTPWWSRADTYELHFDRLYFRGLRLAEATHPALILNATDYLTGNHTAFWAKSYGSEPLSKLVAASGAFPAAFSPVRINERQYSDGGVIDNMGLEGIKAYLEAEKDAPTPKVLLISDAGAEPDSVRPTSKTNAIVEAVNAYDATASALQKRILLPYVTGKDNNTYNRNSSSLNQPYVVSANQFWNGRNGDVNVFVLSSTSPAERQYFGQDKIIEKVAGISTLQELSPFEVNAAFWAGAALAAKYLPNLCAAAQLQKCPEVTLPPVPKL